MDEGFNTFINEMSTAAFNNKEYTPTFENQFILSGYVTPYLKGGNREAISTYPDVVQTPNLGMTAYFKPALGLMLLRNVILGQERFDYAFRHYIKTWAYKHPTPNDFFNCIEMLPVKSWIGSGVAGSIPMQWWIRELKKLIMQKVTLKTAQLSLLSTKVICQCQSF